MSAPWDLNGMNSHGIYGTWLIYIVLHFHLGPPARSFLITPIVQEHINAYHRGEAIQTLTSAFKLSQVAMKARRLSSARSIEKSQHNRYNISCPLLSYIPRNSSPQLITFRHNLVISRFISFAKHVIRPDLGLPQFRSRCLIIIQPSARANCRRPTTLLRDLRVAAIVRQGG
ncbi:hypothetical protein N656DRAFT_255619 [Canariomyces notabilis]|uniref:Uncharacterized protein n=1 Tax=Canariomyces notabilis TaxID=2074819 RepID=A0AAN6TLA4_9PEZI|nr:hypothetical protein N656DRAFT_255619 [Canariomyces arenarius]